MSACIGIGRWLGHRYQPRHSEVRYETRGGEGSILYRTRTYDSDVCARCGHRVHRSADEVTGFDTSTGSVPEIARKRRAS